MAYFVPYADQGFIVSSVNAHVRTYIAYTHIINGEVYSGQIMTGQTSNEPYKVCGVKKFSHREKVSREFN